LRKTKIREGGIVTKCNGKEREGYKTSV
jgi:hypothetical protein